MSPDFLYPQIPILEKIVRPVFVYLFLILALRVFGKRELGSMTPFDLIVLLTISNVLQNAMIGPDNSLTGGLIGATTLFGINLLFARLAFRFPRFEQWVQGHPTLLIRDGRILMANLERESLTLQDLREALAKNQVDLKDELPHIRRAELEPDGTVTITRALTAGEGLQERRRGKTRRMD